MSSNPVRTKSKSDYSRRNGTICIEINDVFGQCNLVIKTAEDKQEINLQTDRPINVADGNYFNFGAISIQTFLNDFYLVSICLELRFAQIPPSKSATSIKLFPHRFE